MRRPNGSKGTTRPPPDVARPAFAIEARGLHFAFGDHTVLRSVDLQILQGARVALLGPNGAGKTTLIRVLGGLLRPTDGDVLIAGRSFGADPLHVRKAIGLVGHQNYLYPELTVAENLQFYARLYRVPRSAERIAGLIDQVGLWARRDDRVVTLSRGMTQRVALARAVLHDPVVLLLDEPDAGIDAHSIAMLEAMLGVSHRTTLMSTHDFANGLRLCRSIAIMHDGRLVDHMLTAGLDLPSLQERYTSATAGNCGAHGPSRPRWSA